MSTRSTVRSILCGHAMAESNLVSSPYRRGCHNIPIYDYVLHYTYILPIIIDDYLTGYNLSRCITNKKFNIQIKNYVKYFKLTPFVSSK